VIRIKGFVDHASRLPRYINHVDLFISAIGWEERFLRGWTILSEKKVKVEKKLLFYFDKVLDHNGNPKDCEKEFDTSFCVTSSDLRLRVDLYDEIEGLLDFEGYIGKILPATKSVNIVTDISVIVKPYIFLLLRHLISLNLERLCFLYTEPMVYNTLTLGTMVAKDVPGYSGAKDMRKKDALIILLGFEGNRAVEVLNESNPDLTIPVIGFPSYKPEFRDKSIMENKELLSENDILKNLRFAPANDPFETKRLLEDIYSQYNRKYNLTIVPLGTKPMAFGSCLFAMEHRDCRIVYSYPKEYFSKPSEDWGETWMYFVQF